MLKILIKAFFILSLFSFSIGLASDHPEEVMLKADRTIKRVLHAFEKEDANLSHILLRPNEEYILNNLEAADIQGDEPTSAQEDLKSLNPQLFNSFNAAISLFSDFLHLAMTDHDLRWTYENTVLLNGLQQKISLDGVAACAHISNKVSEPKVLIRTHKSIYEIERQMHCLNLTAHLELFIYWKSKIFQHSTPSSYSEVNAHALTQQIKETLYQLPSRQELSTVGLTYTVNDFITLMYEEIIAALPQYISHIFSDTLRHSETVTQRKKDSRVKIIKIKRSQYNRSSEAFINYWYELNRQLVRLCEKPLECIKNNHFKTEFQHSYKGFQEQRLLIGRRDRKISPLLNIDKILSSIRLVRFNPLLHEVDESVAHLLPTPTLDKVMEAPLAEKEEALKETEVMQPHLPLVEESSDIVYDNDYWSTEHKRHQQRKKEANKKTESFLLSSYEIELYNFLRDNIFKINSSLKVRNLIKKLTNLHFEVKANPRGNGSVHYVRPTITNPLFAHDIEYATAYFNIHLPSENIPLPYDYYRFLKSGFSNVFGLTLEYVNEQLENMKIYQGIGESSI